MITTALEIPVQRDELDPYPWYQHMRASKPVCFNRFFGWEVFRYKDVLRVLNTSREFSSNPFRDVPDAQRLPMDKSLVFLDPPRHDQLRALVARAFAPAQLSGMKAYIESAALQLLSLVLPSGRMEVMQDFARPLPGMVIAELLGVPPSDRTLFQRWSEAVITGGAAPGRTPEQIEEILSMDAYLQTIIERRRNTPENDLISVLVNAKVEGEQLSDEELRGFCALLLVAGSSTTTHLLGNAFCCFDECPAAVDQLKADPSLLPTALEEIARYRSPVQVQLRVATADSDIGGQRILANQWVLAYLGSANRDEVQFENPDTFDIRRSPNRHVAFGLGGIHYCLGAPLARIEGQIALRAVLGRMADIRRDRSVPLEAVTPGFDGVKRLPISFHPL